MTKPDRTALISRAQAIRDTGASASETAKALGVNKSWVEVNTKSANTQFVSRRANTAASEQARERCVTFFAYALSRSRERRIAG